MNQIGTYLVQAYKDAQEIGTLQTIEKNDYKSFAEYLLNLENNAAQIDIFAASWLMSVKPLMLQLTKQAYIMSKKFSVVCTNPPYMGKLEGQLKKFVIDNYKPYFGDLFSVFIYRNFGFCKNDGYSAFMTPFVWMFIKTYNELRKYIISNKSLTSLIQMEYSAFEEATVPICSFILQNGKTSNNSLCFRLSEFKGGMEVQKEKVLYALKNKNCGYFYESKLEDFNRIPGNPIAYWASENLLNDFEKGTLLSEIAYPRQGMATTNNNMFLRQWYEVSVDRIGFGLHSEEDTISDNLKWFPYNKGGEFRKWFGNNDYVVNFQNKGKEVCDYIDSHSAVDHKGRVINRDKYFKPSVTWSKISSGSIAFRYKPNGFIFDVAGTSIFGNEKTLDTVMSFLNSKVSLAILECLSPTLNYEVGHIGSIPIKKDVLSNDYAYNLSNQNKTYSKADWDSFETSWDFNEHPLIRLSKYICDLTSVSARMLRYYGNNPKVTCPLEQCYLLWQGECNERFNGLKQNEEELNRIFIDIYGLNDELNPYVDDKDVTVRKADLTRDIKSLISYAVGCMFGRYSLDEDGIAYAGGKWDDSKYDTFIPDEDNCIPVTDEEYFEDDIVGRFCDFIKIVFGEDSLEANLKYVANALGNKGTTSRDVIRNYFLNDFIKDHIKIYQKRPIYWMFDSGKQNGFKALVYMHRWNADTIGNMRVEYLHRMQRVYDKEMERMQEIIDNSSDNKEVNAATKRKEKLQKQLKETKDYDAKVAHLALSRIDIDLDDGVKVNYEKVQTPPDGKKMQVLAKI